MKIQTREIHECHIVRQRLLGIHKPEKSMSVVLLGGYSESSSAFWLQSACRPNFGPRCKARNPLCVTTYMQHVHKEWNLCMTVCCGAASWLSQCLPTGTGIVSVSAHRDMNCLSVCPQDRDCLNVCPQGRGCLIVCPHGQGLSQCLPTWTGIVSVSAHRDRDCLSVCPQGQGLFQCLPTGTGIVSVSAHRDRDCLSVCPQDKDCLGVCPQGQKWNTEDRNNGYSE